MKSLLTSLQTPLLPPPKKTAVGTSQALPLVSKRFNINQHVLFTPQDMEMCKETAGKILDWRFIDKNNTYIYSVACSCDAGKHFITQENLAAYVPPPLPTASSKLPQISTKSVW